MAEKLYVDEAEIKWPNLKQKCAALQARRIFRVAFMPDTHPEYRTLPTGYIKETCQKWS